MKSAWDMLRSVAAGVIVCGVVVAAGASAHARTTPSSGVIMISAERAHGLACTATFIPTPIEYADGDQKGAAGSSLNDAYIRLFSRIGAADASEWPQVISVTLRPFVHDVNFNWPTAHDIDSIRYDLQNTYFQSLRSAGCEAQNVATAPVLEADRSAAPEPTTWAMLILGVAMVGLAARRGQRGHAQIF